MVCSKAALSGVLAAMRKAHTYEEVAFDVRLFCFLSVLFLFLALSFANAARRSLNKPLGQAASALAPVVWSLLPLRVCFQKSSTSAQRGLFYMCRSVGRRVANSILCSVCLLPSLLFGGDSVKKQIGVSHLRVARSLKANNRDPTSACGRAAASGHPACFWWIQRRQNAAVASVGICAGSGASLLSNARCDLWLTGEAGTASKSAGPARAFCSMRCVRTPRGVGGHRGRRFRDLVRAQQFRARLLEVDHVARAGGARGRLCVCLFLFSLLF